MDPVLLGKPLSELLAESRRLKANTEELIPEHVAHISGPPIRFVYLASSNHFDESRNICGYFDRDSTYYDFVYPTVRGNRLWMEFVHNSYDYIGDIIIRGKGIQSVKVYNGSCYDGLMDCYELDRRWTRTCGLMDYAIRSLIKEGKTPEDVEHVDCRNYWEKNPQEWVWRSFIPASNIVFTKVGLVVEFDKVIENDRKKELLDGLFDELSAVVGSCTNKVRDQIMNSPVDDKFGDWSISQISTYHIVEVRHKYKEMTQVHLNT